MSSSLLAMFSSLAASGEVKLDDQKLVNYREVHAAKTTDQIIAAAIRRGIKIPREPKAKAEKSVVKVTAGVPAKSTTPIGKLPVSHKGEMTAEQFEAALRIAGKREMTREDGTIVVQCDDAMVGPDQIKAIDAFVGYDYSKPRGTQLDAAQLAARSVTRPVTAKEFHRGSCATVNGYVAGSVDMAARAVADLKGREKMVLNAWIDLCKLPSLQVTTALGTTGPAGKLAALTALSLGEIRDDLRSYEQPRETLTHRLPL